ncbi:ABC transporter ATP-binding protein [Nonomuraea pusilla]|uniref:Carbohydrate ABC transporter ATP-binding protein, CUT1 family (TC 3.A.1.1.-) n=1 Tax=Nonomuraea pusilla TaxID=46177 RepID=A0A1H7X5A5_9ACTN|nr:ABC transporter ATP-binding protein [Nonomuraea pusilla]SEM28795.1 carbohydrate ABC transporter ATP-binding protein, CUT1 family (TC 3.A.1.1.-) [Nonomuraea pusilla]
MPNITLSAVSKSYGGGDHAVKNLDLVVPDGAFMCLLGPSGCGKTTTLRMIAGLEQPTGGTIAVGDRVLDCVERGLYVPPEKRGMGLVFQNYALWPHLSVRENVEFGLRMRKVPAPERRARAEAALKMVHVDAAMDRYPSQLSGGQQQRVALARMLAVNPSVLLLDEPLSNLDARLRLEMRAELKRIHEESGATIVFVTHDQLEALTMATDVAVMSDGELQQLAAPMDMYARPANRFVAEFVGSPPMAIVDVGPSPAGLAGSLLRHVESRGAPERPGGVGIRPEALRFGAPPASAWREEALVEAVLPAGSSWTVRLRILDAELYALSYTPVEAAPGDVLTCWTDQLHLFGADGARMSSWDAAEVRA